MRISAGLTLAIIATGCTNGNGEPVRVTLDDQQVMVGEVFTGVLNLEGAMGMIAIPLEDVGEVKPVEGHDLLASNDQVTVWLRNGTELRGRWDAPELDMGIPIADDFVDVAIPMARMMRFQTTEGMQWPTGEVFRVKTSHGDDLLVDPEQTRVTVTNDLGTFSPSLAECQAIRRVSGPGSDWRLELRNGNVIIGPLATGSDGKTFTFALPLGPETISIESDLVVNMAWQSWGSQANYGSSGSGEWFGSEQLYRAKSTNAM